MKSIKIEWLSDSHDCETCGSSYAYGAKVYLDGQLILDLEPVAHCFDNDSYESEDVFKKILEHLGYDIQDNYEKGR